MSSVQKPAAETPGSAPAETSLRGNSKKRKLGVGALIVVGCLMLLISIFATWVDRVALDSGNWTNISTQALQNPQVRTAVSEQAVNNLYANVNVPALLQEALPPRLKPFAGTIATAAQPYLQRAVAAGLARPRAVETWRLINLHAHQQLMALINGGGTWYSSGNGTVSLNLQPILNNLSSTLNSRTNGAVTIPPNAGNITILKSDQLRLTQDVVKLMKLLAIPMFLAALAMLAIAFVISHDRRKTLRATAWGVIAVGLLLVFVRRVVGNYVVDSLTTVPDMRAAGQAIWWIATEDLGAANLTTIIVGIFGVIGAWVAGPGRRATATRHELTPYLRDPMITYGVYAAVIVLLLIWAPVPAARTFTTAVVLIALGAVGLEILRRMVIREFPEHTERVLGDKVSGWATSGWNQAKGAPATAGAPAGGDRYVELNRLAELHDRGVLTDEEFAAEKSNVLAKG